MKYLLDTCIIQAVLKREPGSDNLQVRIEAAQRGTLAISALTAVEIWVGLARPRTPRARQILFESLLRHMRILAFDEAAARQAYTVRRHLEQTGRDIGRMDPLIAAQAMATSSVCVTDNLRHFLRIPGLTIENWLRPG
ncbi:MAG: type II toxin-antitoxin system VapC family toxin [Burkholderiales bacterium]